VRNKIADVVLGIIENRRGSMTALSNFANARCSGSDGAVQGWGAVCDSPKCDFPVSKALPNSRRRTSGHGAERDYEQACGLARHPGEFALSALTKLPRNSLLGKK